MKTLQGQLCNLPEDEKREFYRKGNDFVKSIAYWRNKEESEAEHAERTSERRWEV